jgi:DNA-binding FadR family transcriptional regulator
MPSARADLLHWSYNRNMAKTPSRSALLARDLLGRIARRELRPGDAIDVPALGRRHGVSRTVVREALADLGGKGLVIARPKVGTTVAPEAAWNLLDPVLIAVAITEPGPDSMLAEATALRRVIEPALAADAALGAGRGQQTAVLQAVSALAGAVGSGDAAGWSTADAGLHAALSAACGNRLLRSVDQALEPVRAAHRLRLAAAQLGRGGAGPELLRTLALQSALGLAIVRRDADAAAAHALALADVALPAMPETATARTASVGHRTDDAAVVIDTGGTPATVAPTAPAPVGGAAPSRTPSTRPDPVEPPTFVPEVAGNDEWPETATLVRDADPLAPHRRGRLEPDDVSPFAVPALIAEAARDAVRRAALR